jgi:hypothetical protein
MATGEDDSGQTWMFPTVLNPNNEGIKVPNQYADYISSEGYKVATGMKQKGGFQDDINRRRKLLRDWTYGASIGMLHKAQEGKNIKTKFREAYPKGTIFTYKDNPDLINSTANFDMISNVEISPEYNEQIKQRLYTGNFGFDPNSGALVKLNKSQQKAIPQDIKDIRTKEKETAEEYKRQVKNENIKQQQELEYLGSMLEAGYDPGTFAGGFLPQKQEYKEYFDYGPRSTEELQNVPVENWTKEELDNWAREGHMAVMHNPLFKTAAYFTPEGIAIGAIDAAVNLLPDLYNRDYLSAAFDASMVLPFLPKGVLKTAAQNVKTGLNRGYNKVATGNSRLTDFGVRAWKVERPNSVIRSSDYIARPYTDAEAKVLSKFGKGMRLSPEEWKEMEALVKSGATDFSKGNYPISRIPGYYERGTAEQKAIEALKRGDVFATPAEENIRTWSAGVPKAAEYLQGKTRLIIPSRYTKNLGTEFAGMPYYDKRVDFIWKHPVQDIPMLNRNAVLEKELMGNIPEGFKVIGRSSEDGMNNLIIRPLKNNKDGGLIKAQTGLENGVIQSVTPFPEAAEVSGDPNMRPAIFEGKDVTVKAQAPEWAKFQKEFQSKDPWERYLKNEQSKYLRKHKNLNRIPGLSFDNFPKAEKERIRQRYDEKMNTYITRRLGKYFDFNPRKRGEWLDLLTDREKQIVAGSKYGSKLQPSAWTNFLSGARSLYNAIPDELKPLVSMGHGHKDITTKIPGLTEAENQERLNDYLEGLNIFSPLDVPGIAIANKMKNMNVQNPSWYSGEMMGNVDTWDAMAVNPLTYMIDLPTTPSALVGIGRGVGKGAATSYKAGKSLLNKVIPAETATAKTTSLTSPVKSGLGAMDMGMYEIKNPDYYTQLLNTYDNKMMPAANRKFYKDLINTVKKQNGLVTERQYMELKRLNTGNFNFGKKAYKKGGSLSKAQDGLAVMNYLINKGLTKEQAAGIAGNLQQESGFNPKAKSRSGYVGIAQWDPSNRWPAVKKYIMSQGYDPYSLEGQLEGLYWEANKRGDWKKIAQAQTPEQAGAAWLKHFEISGEKPGMSGYKSRMSYANKLASTYEPPMEKQVEFVVPPAAEFDTDTYRAEPIVEIGKLPTMPVQQIVQTMPLNGDVALMQTPLSTYDFGGETDYEDLDLTPEEIDWYLANGYELEDLGESETFDDYIPEAQEGLVFKNKTNVIPVKETVAPVKKPAVQQPVKQQPVAPVRRELSPYEKIMAENMKRSMEFPDKKQIIVQDKPVRKLPNKPKAKEEFAFPALNLGSGAPPPSLTRTPSNQPIAGGLGSQFTNVGRAGVIDYNKFAQQQKEAKKSEAKSKTYKQIDASASVRKGLLKEDKRLTDENFKNRAENEKQWVKRFLDKKGVIDVQDYKLDPKKTQNKKAPVVSSTPKPAKFYQELGTVPDSYSPKNKLLSYRNQWDNKEGFEYIATPVKKDRTGKEEYKNVKGVGHFLLDGSVAEGKTYKWKDNDAYINRAKKNNEWIPAFTRVKGDRVRLQYKKANELTKNDIVVSPLRQMRYDEIRFDKTQRPEGFQSGIKEVTKNDGQGTYLLFKDRNGYSRFSGGSVVFIFKDKYGNTIVRDYAGSLNGIENEGINIKKEYNLKPGELTIGYHDVGSFSAKPKSDSTGVLRSSQWDGFNDNGVTGGALLIPNK